MKTTIVSLAIVTGISLTPRGFTAEHGSAEARVYRIRSTNRIYRMAEEKRMVWG